jgi:PPOX class probable F420-dependent enzyme
MLFDRPEVARKLDDDLIGWLTSVSPEGQPQSSPVWFLRDGADLLVYNLTTAKRLRNLRKNPRIAFNLRGDPEGDEVVALEGKATVEDGAPLAHEVPEYLAKYASQIKRLGWTPKEFAEGYPVRLRLDIDRVRA